MDCSLGPAPNASVTKEFDVVSAYCRCSFSSGSTARSTRTGSRSRLISTPPPGSAHTSSHSSCSGERELRIRSPISFLTCYVNSHSSKIQQGWAAYCASSDVALRQRAEHRRLETSPGRMGRKNGSDQQCTPTLYSNTATLSKGS